MTQEVKEKACEIGREIAQQGHILLTGACPGFPYDAVLGAAAQGGKCIGFSPAADRKDHVERYKYPTEGFTELVFVPKNYPHIKNIDVCRKYRNVSSVAASDAAIIIGGRIGTMNEFTLAYDLGKDIGILEESGGITKRAIKVLLEDIDKPAKGRIIWEKDPKRLVERLVSVAD